MKLERADGTATIDDVEGEPIEVRIGLTRKDAEKLASLLPEMRPGATLSTAPFGVKLRLALETMGFKRRRRR